MKRKKKARATSKDVDSQTLNAFHPNLCLFNKEELARLSPTVTVGKEILNLLHMEISQ